MQNGSQTTYRHGLSERYFLSTPVAPTDAESIGVQLVLPSSSTMIAIVGQHCSQSQKYSGVRLVLSTDFPPTEFDARRDRSIRSSLPPRK